MVAPLSLMLVPRRLRRQLYQSPPDQSFDVSFSHRLPITRRLPPTGREPTAGAAPGQGIDAELASLRERSLRAESPQPSRWSPCGPRNCTAQHHRAWSTDGPPRMIRRGGNSTITTQVMRLVDRQPARILQALYRAGGVACPKPFTTASSGSCGSDRSK